MKKSWSISTTVRNPNRLRNFLYVLKQLEGQPFNTENQKKYQILLIQNKLYRPTDLTNEQTKYFNDIEQEISYEMAEDIFYAQSYKDPAIRGRNSVAPMNTMGLCIAKNSEKVVKITSLGKYFLSEEYDLGQLFFIHFLRWQLPNPMSKIFLEQDGFNIKPFIGTLHLIKEVNRIWCTLKKKPVGINKDEFCLFVPTLIDYNNIKQQAEYLIEYRKGIYSQEDDKKKNEFKNNFKQEFAKKFLGNNKEIGRFLNNLKDYGDSTIRYFRLTRFLYIRGNGNYIDLEPRRSFELKKLLEQDTAKSLNFNNKIEYIEYLIKSPQESILPWETKEGLKTIVKNINKDIQKYIKSSQLNIKIIPNFIFQNIKKLDIKNIKKYIEELRSYRRKLQELQTHLDSQNTSNVQEYITELKNIHLSHNKKSIELERLSTLALNAINDALEIKPNYPVGDDNKPIFTAPANKPDIECFYKTFNTVCEVTMLQNRSQWYNEGQPVMRHLRKFEKIYTKYPNYCLFIAPKLHQDTIETFWMSIKYGYRGIPQKIIPISISQFINILEIFLESRKKGISFSHNDILNLYEKILNITTTVSNSQEWIQKIPNIISLWKKSILSN